MTSTSTLDFVRRRLITITFHLFCRENLTYSARKEWLELVKFAIKECLVLGSPLGPADVRKTVELLQEAQVWLMNLSITTTAEHESLPQTRRATQDANDFTPNAEFTTWLLLYAEVELVQLMSRRQTLPAPIKAAGRYRYRGNFSCRAVVLAREYWPGLELRPAEEQMWTDHQTKLLAHELKLICKGQHKAGMIVRAPLPQDIYDKILGMLLCV